MAIQYDQSCELMPQGIRRHRLEAFQPLSRENGANVISWRCVLCGTERYDFIDRYGERVRAPRYRWPKGYKDMASGAPTTERFRLALMRELRKAYR